MNEIPMAYCEGCIYADYDGDDQCGCKLRRLEYFKNTTGIELCPHADGSPGNGYRLLNRMGCSTYRDSHWAHANNSDVEKIRKVREESRIDVDVVVAIGPYDEIDDVLSFANSIYGAHKDSPHYTPPARFIFVLNGSKILPSDFIVKFMDERPKWDYLIKQMVQPSSESNAFDAGVESATSRWIWLTSVFKEEEDRGIISRANYLINTRLERFALVNFEESGVLTLRNFYNSLGGQKPIELFIDEKSFVLEDYINKACKIALEQNQLHMVWDSQAFYLKFSEEELDELL